MTQNWQHPSLSTIPIDSLLNSTSSSINLPTASLRSSLKSCNSIIDPFLLSQLRPNYGSLDEFMVGSAISKDIYSYHKKRVQIETLQQKQMEANDKIMRMRIKQELPQNTLIRESTIKQKIIAAQMITDKIFQQYFKMPINEFKLHNEGQQQRYMMDINRLRERLDNIVSKQNSPQQSEKEHTILVKKQNSIKNRNSKGVDREHVLNEIHMKYGINKKDYLQNKHKVHKKSNQTVKFIDVSQIHSEQTRDSLPIPMQLENNVKITQESMRIRDVGRQEKKALQEYIVELLQSHLLLKVKKISLSNVAISPKIYYYLLQYIHKCLPQLQYLQLNEMGLSKRDNLWIEILSKIIQQNNLQSLIITNNQITSKQFCYLCLSVIYNDFLTLLDVSSNPIDQFAIKSMKIISKFHRNLQIAISNIAALKNLCKNGYFIKTK